MSIILVCHHFSVLAFRTPSAMVVCAVAKLRHTVLFLFGGAGTAHCGPLVDNGAVSEELRELAGSSEIASFTHSIVNLSSLLASSGPLVCLSEHMVEVGRQTGHKLTVVPFGGQQMKPFLRSCLSSQVPQK